MPEPIRSGPRPDVSDGARFVRPSLEQIPAGDPVAAARGRGRLARAQRGPERAVPVRPRCDRGGGARASTATRAVAPHELVAALAARHEVPAAQVLVAAGADAVIGYVCQAVLEPGDEVVVPWPSFPSFVRDPQKRDAVPVTVPARRGLDRPRCDQGGGHAAHPAALRRDAEQPDRAGDLRATTLIAFVARPPRARPARDRRGLLRLPRPRRPARRDRRPRADRRRRARAADVLEALRPGGAAGRLRRRAGGRRLRDAEGSARLRRRDARARWPHWRASATTTRSRSGAPRTALRSRRSSRCSATGVSSRSPTASTNFVLVDVGSRRRRARGGAASRRGVRCSPACRSEPRPRCGSVQARRPISRFSTPHSATPGSGRVNALCKRRGPRPGPSVSWPDGRTAPVFVCGRHSREA